MKLIRCPQMHYYDSSKYTSCPFCTRTAEKTESEKKQIIPEPMVGLMMPVDKAEERIDSSSPGIGDTSLSTALGGKLIPSQPCEAHDEETVVLDVAGEADPVVGWLVCLKGAYIGRSFTLSNGFNQLGRASAMAISLPHEKSIAEMAHATIVFDPMNALFTVMPGQENSETAVNGISASKPTQLQAYDILRFGESEFLFVPLCGEHFDWKSYIGQ